MTDDLIIPQQQEFATSSKLVRAEKDAEACSVCGGTMPELYWNGFSMVHDRCARDAKAARRLEEPSSEKMNVDQFMVKLAANPKLVRRLFHAARH